MYPPPRTVAHVAPTALQWRTNQHRCLHRLQCTACAAQEVGLQCVYVDGRDVGVDAGTTGGNAAGECPCTLGGSSVRISARSQNMCDHRCHYGNEIQWETHFATQRDERAWGWGKTGLIKTWNQDGGCRRSVCTFSSIPGRVLHDEYQMRWAGCCYMAVANTAAS